MTPPVQRDPWSPGGEEDRLTASGPGETATSHPPERSSSGTGDTLGAAPQHPRRRTLIILGGYLSVAPARPPQTWPPSQTWFRQVTQFENDLKSSGSMSLQELLCVGWVGISLLHFVEKHRVLFLYTILLLISAQSILLRLIRRLAIFRDFTFWPRYNLQLPHWLTCYMMSTFIWPYISQESRVF